MLFQKNYRETGSVKYYQILIPKQLVSEVHRNLHGEFGKHPGNTKTKIAYRGKFINQIWLNYSRSGSYHVNNVSKSHELTIASPTFPCKTPRSTLLRQKTPCKFPSLRPVAMEILCQPWTSFPAVYLHTRHQIRTPKQIAKVINNIMTKHAYLLTTLISDKGTAFMSHVIKEVVGVLGVTLKRATTKHA